MAASESRYRAFLDARAREGLRRSLLTVAARDARIIGAEGRSYVNFASNDYLGLRFNQALIGRAIEWAETYGVGSGASRLVTGNLDLFAPIEAKLATLKGKPAALVMASGFQTNAAVLQALFDKTVLGAEPLVFADRLNHASMHFGCQAAGVRQLRYRHCDAAHLAELLSQYQGDDRPRFILTESVFSMDGDVAPLADIARLAREHDACLIVDDAHATGILGRGGSGLSGDADIVIGTFSKALGGFGGYVASTRDDARLSRSIAVAASSTRRRCRRRCSAPSTPRSTSCPAWMKSGPMSRAWPSGFAQARAPSGSIPAPRPRRSCLSSWDRRKLLSP